MAVEKQTNEIPVDNLEFSTFSTGFSTRVFHMKKRLNIKKQQAQQLNQKLQKQKLKIAVQTL